VKRSHWLLILAPPLILIGGYWTLESARPGAIDCIVLAAATAIGVEGIRSAPWRKTVRVAAGIGYTAAMLLGGAYVLLALECSAGNCF
jgi:hypothetical protein